METFYVSNRRVALYVPDGANTIVYIPSSHGEEGALPLGCAAAFVETDWNRELSPWKAERVFRDGEDFSGGGELFLRELEEDIIPQAEARLPFAVKDRGIAGYSLAGLFAAWSLFKTDAFSLAGCMSPSLWFDGFLDFMAQNTPHVPRRMYFSVGAREKRTKNPRMATVEDCIRKTESYFASLGAETTLELNPGGHFNDPNERIKRGIAWLI